MVTHHSDGDLASHAHGHGHGHSNNDDSALGHAEKGGRGSRPGTPGGDVIFPSSTHHHINAVSHAPTFRPSHMTHHHITSHHITLHHLIVTSSHTPFHTPFHTPSNSPPGIPLYLTHPFIYPLYNFSHILSNTSSTQPLSHTLLPFHPCASYLLSPIHPSTHPHTPHTLLTSQLMVVVDGAVVTVKVHHIYLLTHPLTHPFTHIHTYLLSSHPSTPTNTLSPPLPPSPFLSADGRSRRSSGHSQSASPLEGHSRRPSGSIEPIK